MLQCVCPTQVVGLRFSRALGSLVRFYVSAFFGNGKLPAWAQCTDADGQFSLQGCLNSALTTREQTNVFIKTKNHSNSNWEEKRHFSFLRNRISKLSIPTDNATDNVYCCDLVKYLCSFIGFYLANQGL